MPHWCENELYIEGPKEDLDRFKKEAAGENGCLDMNSFIPYPIQFRNQEVICEIYKDEIQEHNRGIYEKFHQMTPEEQEQYWTDHNGTYGFKESDGGYSCGGCDWCYENWGTKWNFCYLKPVVEGDNSLYYEFDTAANPPEPVIRKMGERFPMLRFELRSFEHAMEFNGILVIEEGEVVRSECGPYFGHRGG